MGKNQAKGCMRSKQTSDPGKGGGGGVRYRFKAKYSLLCCINLSERSGGNVEIVQKNLYQ